MNEQDDRTDDIPSGSEPSLGRDFQGQWPTETAAGTAYQVLDEAALRLLEIQLALTVVSNEVAMRFDELLPDLAKIEVRMDQAIQAISLLLQQADLSDDRRTVPMSPVAINRRHKAAVGRGAPQIFPIPSSVRRFNRLLGNASNDQNLWMTLGEGA